MKRNTATRLAATAAGGLLAIGIAGPAAAHDTPAEGFNAVLHGPHHDRLVGDEGWPDCGNVSSDAGDAADELVKPGFDVWVFNATNRTFDPDPAGDLAQIRFSDGAGDDVVVTVPGGAGNPTGFAWWIGPDANPNKLAVSVPQGWTLRDGDFLVQAGPGPSPRVVVTHTCPDQGNGTPPTTPPSTPPTTAPPPSPTPSITDSPVPTGTPSASTPTGGEGGGGLPVTGGQAGLLALAGLGLLGAGSAAMVLVRRKRSQFGLGNDAGA